MNEKRACIGWTSRRDFRNNLPCGRRALPDSNFCKIHDPRHIEARDKQRMERMKAKRGELA